MALELCAMPLEDAESIRFLCVLSTDEFYWGVKAIRASDNLQQFVVELNIQTCAINLDSTFLKVSLEPLFIESSPVRLWQTSQTTDRESRL